MLTICNKPSLDHRLSNSPDPHDPSEPPHFGARRAIAAGHGRSLVGTSYPVARAKLRSGIRSILLGAHATARAWGRSPGRSSRFRVGPRGGSGRVARAYSQRLSMYSQTLHEIASSAEWSPRASDTQSGPAWPWRKGASSSPRSTRGRARARRRVGMLDRVDQGPGGRGPGIVEDHRQRRALGPAGVALGDFESERRQPEVARVSVWTESKRWVSSIGGSPRREADGMFRIMGEEG